MIHQSITWSTDISKAPKGDTVNVPFTTMVKGEPQARTRQEHQTVKILALTNCGMVVSSYWIPPKKGATGVVTDVGRWSGFNPGSDPVLWAPWPDAEQLTQTYAAIKSADDFLAHSEQDA